MADERHLLREAASGTYTARCGVTVVKAKRLPHHFTAWASEVDCPECLGTVPEPIPEQAEMFGVDSLPG